MGRLVSAHVMQGLAELHTLYIKGFFYSKLRSLRTAPIMNLKQTLVAFALVIPVFTLSQTWDQCRPIRVSETVEYLLMNLYRWRDNACQFETPRFYPH